ncbi:MAG: glycosyltransferase family 4 protein [Chloroflexi bacterium]|nr:glycosyltransferase family 4 protein [Chloroflexota bacterium]
MKVLIITPFFAPNVGGLESHLMALTKYLTSHQHGVHVITYRPLTTRAPYKSREYQDNLEIRRVWWWGHNLFELFAPYPALVFLYMVPALLMHTLIYILRNRNQIEVIHSHGLVAAFVCRCVTAFFNRRMVVSTHYIYGLRHRPIMARVMKWTLAASDIILAVGDESKKELIEAGIPGEKIRIYHQWVDQELFRDREKQECRHALGLANTFTVLFVGRLLEMKGVLVLREVARHFTDEANFVFVGDGPLAGILREDSQRESNTIYAGRKHATELSTFYGAADIAILPSQSAEGSPLVVAESLSCGCPIIVTDKGAVSDMISPEVGVVLDPTVDNLCQQIRFFLQNPEKLARIASGCRKYALMKFGEGNAELIAASYVN